MYAPKGANTSFVGATWAGGLTNFTFDKNVYYFDGEPAGQKMFNFTDAQKFNENFTEWQVCARAFPWPSRILCAPSRLTSHHTVCCRRTART